LARRSAMDEATALGVWEFDRATDLGRRWPRWFALASLRERVALS
jgi:hypothetical protein